MKSAFLTISGLYPGGLILLYKRFIVFMVTERSDWISVYEKEKSIECVPALSGSGPEVAYIFQQWLFLLLV